MTFNIQLLVVDDIRTDRVIVRSMLEQAGVRQKMIFFADCGVRVLEFLETNSENTDAIFMDVNMPVLDGITTAGIIKKIYPRIKIIGVSSDPPDKSAGVFDDYVMKPFSKKQFRDILEKHFRRFQDPHFDEIEDFDRNFSFDGSRGKKIAELLRR